MGFMGIGLNPSRPLVPLRWILPDLLLLIQHTTPPIITATSTRALNATTANMAGTNLLIISIDAEISSDIKKEGALAVTLRPL
jgi:hypothetical protein